MSTFFTIPKSQKRKRADGTRSTNVKKPRGDVSSGTNRPRLTNAPDEEISGSESGLSGNEDTGYESPETDASEERETAAEKRLRLAEEYLEKVRRETEQGQDIGFDAEEIDRDLIAERLKEDVAEQKGKLYRFVASSYSWDTPKRGFFGSHTSAATTAVALDGENLYTATKDLRLSKWKLPQPSDRFVDPASSEITGQSELSKSQRRKLRARRKREHAAVPVLVASTKGSHKRKRDKHFDHHVAPILCLACSPSGDLLISGGADKRIIAWDAKSLQPKRVFVQHRGAVTSLVFRRNANEMFSASTDRTIKVWSMDELAYVETLFGHQDEVLDVGALGMQRCVSVGGRDRTARVWKVTEETQLVFRGGGSAFDKELKKHGKRDQGSHSKDERLEIKARSGYGEGSIDRVALVDDEMFVTGSDNGSLCLWSVQKKKPVHVIPLAHGIDPQLSADEAFAEEDSTDREIPGPTLPRSITALAVLPYSDIVISGSWEGVLRVWRITADKRRLEPAGVLGEVHNSSTLHQPVLIDPSGLGNGSTNKIKFDEPTAATEGHSIDDISGDLSDEHVVVEGRVVEQHEGNPVNGDLSTNGHAAGKSRSNQDLTGVVNDLKITERGERGNESLLIAVALGIEPRLGRWRTFQNGRNGACLFEVFKSSHQRGAPELATFDSDGEIDV